jgi:hypothetical protein
MSQRPTHFPALPCDREGKVGELATSLDYRGGAGAQAKK